MADPKVVQVVREYKANLLDREEVQMRDMTQRWLQVENKLQANIDVLAQEIALMRANGEVVSEARLWRQGRYKTLLNQLNRELEKYNAYANRSITSEQKQYGQIAMQSVLDQLQASGVEISTDWNRLPIAQVEMMAGLAGNGSPLKTLLDDTWPDAVDGLTKALIQGTALGWNPRKTAREALDGMADGLQRALTIARTEQLRVYREASYQGYESSGVVEGFYRIAAHDGRACIACLASEGEFYPLASGQRLRDHPRGRCAMIPRIIGMPPVEFQTGEDWLREQPIATQREALGPGRYELWQSGKVPFARFSKIVHNETWGDSVTPTPLRELQPAA